MQQEEITYSSTASVLRRALSKPQPDPSHSKVAAVLERAIAPDMMPVTLQVDDQEVETVQYIAELAEIIRHRGAATPTNGVKSRKRSHQTWET